jgi:predicted secreted protein
MKTTTEAVMSKLLCTAILLLATAAAGAAEPGAPRYNLVEFQADAQREVQNDLLNATLYVELNDASPAALASAINKRVNEALRVAKEYQGVRARSGGNQTFPVYSRSNVLQGWRGRAEIRLESRDFEAASALIARLQKDMQLGGVSFSVSPETRRAVESELITEAVAAFKARADVVRAAVGGTGYRLVRLDVGGGFQAPQPRMAMARSAVSSQEVAAPEFEGGVTQITMTARGAIEVIEK